MWLVAQYLKSHKKSKINIMKLQCASNNVAERVSSLRKTYGWIIHCRLEKYVDGVGIWYYEVEKKGIMPKQFK